MAMKNSPTLAVLPALALAALLIGAGQTATLGHRIKSTRCHVSKLLPDAGCTPGSIFTKATVRQICTPGYSRSVRNVPASLKRSVYAEYGIKTHTPGSYEVDHLVSLE